MICEGRAFQMWLSHSSWMESVPYTRGPGHLLCSFYHVREDQEVGLHQTSHLTSAGTVALHFLVSRILRKDNIYCFSTSVCDTLWISSGIMWDTQHPTPTCTPTPVTCTPCSHAQVVPYWYSKSFPSFPRAQKQYGPEENGFVGQAKLSRHRNPVS